MSQEWNSLAKAHSYLLILGCTWPLPSGSDLPWHSHSISPRRSVKQLTVAGRFAFIGDCVLSCKPSQVRPLRTRPSHFVHFTSLDRLSFAATPDITDFRTFPRRSRWLSLTPGSNGHCHCLVGIISARSPRSFGGMPYSPSNDSGTVGCLRLTNRQLVPNHVCRRRATWRVKPQIRTNYTTIT